MAVGQDQRIAAGFPFLERFDAVRGQRGVEAEQLNVEIQKTMAGEELKKRFAEFGAVAAPTTPDGFNTIVKNEIAKWGKVIREANIKAE